MPPFKLLVVDFEHGLVELLDHVFSREGYTVATFYPEYESGIVHKIAEQEQAIKPDLLIICVGIREETLFHEQAKGYEILPLGLKAVELIRERSEVPVVYLSLGESPQTHPELWDRIARTNPVDLLSKPFVVDELVFSVEMAVNQTQSKKSHGYFSQPTVGQRLDRTQYLLSALDALHRKEFERQQESKRADESQRRLQAVFDCAGDAIFIKDDSLKYTMVNPAMAELFGKTVTDFLEQTDHELYEKEDADRFREVELRVIAGESIEGEHRRTINGIEYTFLDSRIPMKNEAGAIIGICGISRNITERQGIRESDLKTNYEYPSEAMRNCLDEANLVAGLDTTVLLLGESGSGKDFLARYIHDQSKRRDGPFHSINCASIPPDLAESELFGHEPGAFTGARSTKRGHLELAEGGTLLLNEVGELLQAQQAKLLTFLDTSSFTRVGGEKTVSPNVRIMSATNRDLTKEMVEGRFREDLFYRLNVMEIKVPSLRDHMEDLPVLVPVILQSLCKKLGFKSMPIPTPIDFRVLNSYIWPGNVRELKNVLERAIITSEGNKLNLKEALSRASNRTLAPDEYDQSDQNKWHLPVGFQKDASGDDLFREVHRSLINEALSRTKGNKTQAARLLGVSLPMLKSKLKTLGITGPK